VDPSKLEVKLEVKTESTVDVKKEDLRRDLLKDLTKPDVVCKQEIDNAYAAPAKAPFDGVKGMMAQLMQMKPVEAPKTGLQALAGLTSAKPSIETRPTGLGGLSSLLSMPHVAQVKTEQEHADHPLRQKRAAKKPDVT